MSLHGFLAMKKYRNARSSPEARQHFLGESLDHFKEAVDREITSPDGYIGLSMYYYFTGKEDLCLNHLNSAVDYGFDNEPLEGDRSFRSFFKDKKVKKRLKARN
jgi:hypothetical protein